MVTSGRAAFFACIWDDLKGAATKCGWALGLHGSLTKDMDIMAMPWTEDAVPVEEMIKALSNCFTDNPFAGEHIVPHYGKPNGRVVYTMSIWADFYLDINVIQNTQNNMSDCSKHKKEIAGISDMKVFAEEVGDLHYETLTQFLYYLSKKIGEDANKDYSGGRDKLAGALQDAEASVFESSLRIEKAWQISKPFMSAISNNDALKEAQKMMKIPMDELPVLAREFSRYLSGKIGNCAEAYLTAYAAYNQMVLGMKCEDKLYVITKSDLLTWWADRGYYLKNS